MFPEPLANKQAADGRQAGRSWLPKRLGSIKGWRSLGRKFRQELDQGLNRMRRLIKETEKEIQRLGDHEQEFFLAAQDMTEQGSQVVELVSGQAVNEAAQQLEQLVDGIGARFGKLRVGFLKNLEILASVQDEVAIAGRPLAGFQKMVMGLNVLGISTRIESSRMQGADEGFQFLAEEVSRLSDTIKEQTEGMASHLGKLCVRLEEVLGSMKGLAAGLTDRVNNLLTVIGQSLEELRQWRSGSETAAARMAGNTRQVHADMAEVISSMQFHDITRQRLEHVQETLSGMLEGRAESPPADVCGLQAALLRHAEDELYQAAGTIQTSLRGIAGSVRVVAQEANLLIRGNGKQDVSFLERLEDDLSGIMAIADQAEQALVRLREMVESVVETLEQVGSSLRSIDKISYSIKFVALNAAIKSARLGDKGVALGSLAQAIQTLSAEAQASTRNLAEVLSHLGESAESLRQSIQMEAEAESGDQTVRELESILESIRAGDQACKELLGELERNGNDLAGRMEKEADGIRFHLSISQGISGVMVCLEQIAGPTGSQKIKPRAETRSAQNSEHYTMASERRIHQAWTQGEVPGQQRKAVAKPKPAPDTVTAPPPESQTAQDDSDLGDNVELF
jgi:methyl-accepting chemotaxis protein